jgi:uncharacterized protein (TIGR00369 family)
MVASHMDVRTHKLASSRLVGEPIEIISGEYAKAILKTNTEMAVDSGGLIHGGFAFNLADYAAMIAVNEPNVVLVSSNAHFTKPVRAGEELVAEARVNRVEGRRRFVKVTVSSEKGTVFEGEFLCVVPDRHVLEGIS